ncbi:hypothetical protein M902_3264 [Bacteriovorax sp. BAL6_X]|uniref:hypothetical protein n=1 Tax=Bacteriovorax sp. BAL6_X TaxID=1201290 RepID=UPI000386BAD3|nr:hypothetical protein [Bacteriovorax sp. BAL6_X]EPZ50644.1 hypothetical protein M902_3264 [Bacteriovorax sp. BAL6_X]
MKISQTLLLCIISILPLSILAKDHSIPGEFSLGIGNLTKYVGKIQSDIDGGRNYFAFNPFIRANFRTDIPWQKALNIEAGLTIPKSSEDSAVTVTNFWIQALIEHTFNQHFRIHAGLGIFFTYTAMDGEIQTLGNGMSTQQFYTPEDYQTAINNIVIVGGDYLFNKSYYLNGQLSVFNIEDGQERAFSYALSINYTFGNK